MCFKSLTCREKLIAQDGIAIMDHNAEDAPTRASKACEVLRAGDAWINRGQLADVRPGCPQNRTT